MGNRNEEQLRTSLSITPQQTTTEFTCLIIAAHRDMSSIYTECRTMQILLSYCIFKYEQITYWEVRVLVESWMQLIWCRDWNWFSALVGMIEYWKGQVSKCKNRGHPKLNVGYVWYLNLWIRKLCVIVPAAFLKWVLSLMNVTLYLHKVALDCLCILLFVLTKIWRYLSDESNTWMGLLWSAF